MKNKSLFDENYLYYDRWFEKHPKIFETELRAIKKVIPDFKTGLEIGTGTGRFAAALGIQTGIEPSKNMAGLAKKRGIKVIDGIGESLPFKNNSFDLVLIVTTICFAKDPQQMIKEANRVLRDNGTILIAFVDKNSPLGQNYLKNRHKSRFYKEATFFDKKEIFNLLKREGFVVEECVETLFGDDLKHLKLKIYNGCKKNGAFVVLKGRKNGIDARC